MPERAIPDTSVYEGLRRAPADGFFFWSRLFSLQATLHSFIKKTFKTREVMKTVELYLPSITPGYNCIWKNLNVSLTSLTLNESVYIARSKLKPRNWSTTH